ncbi:MAG TPA: copper resistance protein B [Dokdonella sp.]|uniref:copper resistance protein B n=1 Tax=Dokdonella sp. TaxID=2291710 RepID=UPI002D808456|nr:copper resistance protein B [Dokdonella sp.]HET9032829.1 copper resistance protein B [Dokdonella sp.]
MNHSIYPATTVMALALSLALHGSAVAQDHQGHAAAPPETVAHDHPAPQVKTPKKMDAEAAHDHAGHAGHENTAPHRQDSLRPAEASARSASPVDHAAMDHDAMDHGAMDHGAMDHSTMDHSAMGHGKPASPSEPITSIPVVTDADRAAAFPELHLHMQHAQKINSYVAFNRLEVWNADPGSGQAWEGQAWVGSDLNRLWLRSEGERLGGETEAADLEAFYGHSVSTWWDVLVGIKHDFKPGESQTWAAFGVQGLAPYKFEVSATVYVGESGQTAASVEAEYELLLTNRLILQPLVEINVFGKDDPSRGIGSGLSSLEAGVRLRYEIDRKFAPYVGVVHERVFGDTASLRRDEGQDTCDTRLVAGVRIWF